MVAFHASYSLPLSLAKYLACLASLGVLPYMGYIGMYRQKGYGFSAVWIMKRLSISIDFGNFGQKQGVFFLF